MIAKLLNKKIVASFDKDIENLLKITGTDVYNGFPKLNSALGFGVAECF